MSVPLPLERGALLDRTGRLAPGDAWRGVLLCAGPGWGKTVLLDQLARLLGATRRVIRLDPVSPGGDIERALDGTMARTDVLIADDIPRPLEAMLAAAVADSRVVALIGSRRPPGPTWARLLATGTIGCWGPRELAFTPEEAAALFRIESGREAPPGWGELAGRLAGWPLGLAGVLRARTPDGSFDPGEGKLPEALLDLVGGELWDPLPGPLRDLAARASLLRRPTPAALEALAITPQGLRELQEAGVLLPGPRQGEPAIAPGLREFIAGRAPLAPSDLREWHLRAAQAWEAVEDWESAIGHYLVAATPGPHRCPPPVGPRAWLAAFDRGPGEPLLLLWESRLAFEEGRDGDAERSLEAALAGFEARADAAGRFACHVVAATRALARGDLAAFDREAELAAPLEDQGTPEDQVELLLAMGALAETEANPGRAAELAGAAKALPPFGKREAALSRVLLEAAAPAPAPGLTVRALGEFTVLLPDGREAVWPRRKAKVALGFLLLSPRGVDRLALAEAVSGGLVGKEAEDGLRVAIHALRRALEPELARGASSRHVLFDADRYRLAPGAVARSDLADLETLLERAASARAAGDTETAAGIFESAGQAFAGDLFDEEGLVVWFEIARTALRNRVLEGLEFAARHYSGYARERVARRMVDIAPTSEEAQTELIQAYLATGRRDLARNQFWLYRKVLARELGSEPSEELAALVV